MPSSPKQNSYPNDEFINNLIKFLEILFNASLEVVRGILEFRAPLFITATVTFLVRCALLNQLDFHYFGKGSLFTWIWTKPQLWELYYYFMLVLPSLTWGSIRHFRKKNYNTKVETLFKETGVTNRLGQTPKPVTQFQNKDGSKTLRVSASGISVEDFKKSKAQLEQSLRANIESFNANISQGTIDIKYGTEVTPQDFYLEGIDIRELKASEFIVGKSRGKLIRDSLNHVPHLLIAGETGSGKSTFLRQFITSLYYNDNSLESLLIDLKGGLEFSLYKNHSRLKIATDLDSAITGILNIESGIQKRFKLLEAHNSKNIESFNQKYPHQELNRLLIVIDEVAEFFLSSSFKSDSGLEKAKSLLNKIARQGRAIGELVPKVVRV